MVSLSGLSLYFGGQDIFHNISFSIHKGDKIGLVGKNGAGKSTLLKLLANEISPNQGDISFFKDLRIGYLTQDLEFEDSRNLIDEAKTAFSNLNDIELNMNLLNEQLINRTDYDSAEYMSIINQFNDHEERFRVLGGHDIISNISQILIGLGFNKKDFDRHTGEFSGGWRMRIELAKILLKKPDLLLLDEPTNHLDIESIIWLEEWLSNYDGAIVLVSHDKIFLDSITNRTIEIAFAKINDYKSSYTKFLELRKDRIEKQIQAKKNQDRYIRDTKVLIDKFRAKKNKAAFAQSLITKLDKLEIINIEQEDTAHMQFKFPTAPHSGKLTLEIKNTSKSYEDLKVLDNINLQLSRKDKIAFVGKNGQGKTTLLKMIVNEIPFEGEIKLGHKVNMGYYAQDQSDLLDKNKTVLEVIEDACTEDTAGKARSILGSFLFSNDEVDKKIKVLSGGERARVALCKLLLTPYNLLIMDEPTNHLDITSKELLKKALLKYDGSLILVSHDREFLQGLSSKVYEFENFNIKEYFGDINVFLNEKDTNGANVQNSEDSNGSNKITNANKESYLLDKKKKNKIRTLRNKISNIEKKISELENEQNMIEEKLSDPQQSKELLKEDVVLNKYENNKKEILNMESEWSKLVDELELLL